VKEDERHGDVLGLEQDIHRVPRGRHRPNSPGDENVLAQLRLRPVVEKLVRHDTTDDTRCTRVGRMEATLLQLGELALGLAFLCALTWRASPLGAA
jgi:hypothetical protein